MKTEQNVKHVCCFIEKYSQNFSLIQFTVVLDLSKYHVKDTYWEQYIICAFINYMYRYKFFPILYNKAAESRL